MSGPERPVTKDQAETSVLFELIARRYETRSLAIAANQPFSAWDRIFPDKAVTVAAIDRLVHHATILEMNVDSYRRRAAAGRTAARADAAATANSHNNLSADRDSLANNTRGGHHRLNQPPQRPNRPTWLTLTDIKVDALHGSLFLISPRFTPQWRAEAAGDLAEHGGGADFSLAVATGRRYVGNRPVGTAHAA